VALIAIALFVLPDASALAQCPDTISNMSPNGVTDVPSVGQLTWSIANGVSADFFRVFFGPAGQGCNLKDPTLTSSYGGANFTIEYEDLAPNTQYEWRVEAVKNGCVTVASACATFRSSPCSKNAPNLIAPADRATDDHLKTTFAWDPVFGATGYDVWVMINGAPATKVGSTTTATNLTVDVPAGTHQWYVDALFGPTCPPARSEVRTFGTACPTGVPAPVNPVADQSVQSPSNIRFEWTTVSGADGYDVFVSRAGSQAQLIGSTREGVELPATYITASLPGPGTYIWTIDALSSGCPTIHSAGTTFTVVDLCAKSPPTLIAPANGAVATSPVAFTWTAIPNAASAGLLAYKVWVSIGGATATVVETTTDTTASVNLPVGSHSWFVEATFAGCASLSSSQNNFTINAPPVCPTAGPTLITPAQGATDVPSPVQFSWSKLQTASAYLLYVSSNGATPIVQTTTATSATVLVPQGSVDWYVEAVFEGCARAASSHGNFIAALPSCGNPAPVVVEPPDGAIITRVAGDPPPNFIWHAVTGARSYTLTILINGQTVVIPNLTETIFTADSIAISNASVEWFVTAVFDGCLPTSSAHARFTAIERPPCTLAAPIPMSPASGSSTTDPIMDFKWTAVDRATEYRVFAHVDPNSSDFALIGRTSGETTLEATVPFRANQWYVEAAGGARCIPSQSSIVPFTVARAPACNTKPAVLVSPNSQQSVTNPVQFIWNSVSGALGYRLWVVAAGGTPTPIGGVTDPSVLTGTANVPAGDVEWFVEAIYPGCDAAFSERRRMSVVSCDIRPPVLTLPFESANNLTSPVTLAWTTVNGATSYDVYAGVDRSPKQIATIPVQAGSPDNTHISVSFNTGAVTWFVRPFVPNCSVPDSAAGHFFVVNPPPCTTPDAPVPALQGEVTANQPYPLLWGVVPNAQLYEAQESLTPDFLNATTQTTSTPQISFSHDAPVDTTYYYRVRAKSSCGAGLGPYSSVARIRVKSSTTTGSAQSTTSVGSQQIVLQMIFVAGTPGLTRHFNARTDKPWATVIPSSGDLPPEGTTLTLTADPRNLQPGANQATVILDFTGGASGSIAAQDATPVTSVPVSVSLVAPVLPTGKETPPADALIVPAVASARGVSGSQFVSDVRLTNTSAESVRYNILFTPSGTDGTRSGKQASIDVPAGQTIALDDVLRSWYGVGTNQSVTGVLDIRPLRAGASPSALTKSRTTLGSSRTYNVTPAGTFGQFIPAVPFSQFAGKGQTLTMNELSESTQFRTNLGLVEGSGQPASVHVTIYSGSGKTSTSFDVGLQPGEQKQINQVLRANNVISDNSRIDVQVTSDTGRVTAYASVLDNRTNDPMLVSPKEFAKLAETRIVLPGIADLDTGFAQWRSDITLTNGGSAPVTATLTYYPSGDPGNPKTATQTLAPNESKQFTSVLRQMFNTTNSSGAVQVTTATPSQLMVSGRTYSDIGNGTFGQFIPGVSEREGLGRDAGSLQVQQVEESSSFRTNLGVVELSGKAVTLEVSLIQPDAKVAPRTSIDLKPNEFRQFNSIAKSLGISTLYNGRITVRVTDGDGRVAVYGSMVDNRTGDPTYIPGEQ
jgi:hypothetical protein